MNEKKFSDLLAKKLRELELICAPLKSDPEPGQMDLELAVEKIRELHDFLSGQMKDKPETLPEPVISKSVTEVVKTPEKTEIKSTETKKATPFIDVNRPQQVPQSPQAKPNITEMVPEETIELTNDENNGITPPDEPPLREPRKEGKSIIAERFQKTDKKFINENLGKNKSGSDLTSKIQNKPITDLRASIGINEKFLFIKELFKGNNDYYIKSIDFLNQAGSLENAMQYIHENFQWDKESETTAKFLELIHRKFQK